MISVCRDDDALMSDSDRVAVFFCIAGNYWPHGAVAVSSMARYASCLDVWVYYEKPNQRWQSKIRRLLASSGSTVTFVPFDLAMLKGMKECGHPGLSTYYRLFIPDLLPKSLRRIVYLDADLILRQSIRDLFVQPLGECVIGAVFGRASSYQNDVRRLGLPEGSRYFNAGVMVIDLCRWRELGVREICLRYLRDHPEKVVYADQDLLNATLQGLCAQLPSAWNVTVNMFSSPPAQTAQDHSSADFSALLSNPVIVHFNGQYKPWHLRYRHPFKAEYLALRRHLQFRPYISDDLFSLPLRLFRRVVA